MITFLKWLEYADMGGETDYTGQNNATYGLPVDSKYMATETRPKATKTLYDPKKLFGIRNCKKKMKK